MSDIWWVLLDKGGAILGQLCQDENPAPRHAAGVRFDRAVQVDRPGDLRLEILDEATGTWLPDEEAITAVKVAEIKLQAERDCLSISPLWQQLNDVRNPTAEGQARFDAIDAIRAKSNADEAAMLRRKLLGGS
jgi:hypothetical protein